MNVTVIGLRAFPSNFLGMSGVESYFSEMVTFLTNSSRLSFTLYTRKKYQKTFFLNTPIVKVVPLLTISSKVFETVIYTFLASCQAALNSSEVIWYQGVGPALFAWIPKLFGKKILVTVHSLDWERKKWSKFEQTAFYFVTFLIFKIPQKVIVVSKKLQFEVKNIYGVNSVYAPPGLTLFSQPKIARNGRHEMYLLYLGRIVPEKRVDWLLKAFLEISEKKSLKSLQLVIAGGHGNTPDYEASLRKKYKSSRILWTGYVFGEEKENLLRDCACFVLPSELEGNSVSLLEAISLQKRCVVSESIIEDDFKKLAFVHTFPTESYPQFRKVLVAALASHQNKRVRLPLGFQEKYSWENTATIYKKVLNHL